MREYVPSGRRTRPAVAASIIALAVYQARPAETTKTQPAVVSQPLEPVRNAIAARTDRAPNRGRKALALAVEGAAALLLSWNLAGWGIRGS